MKNPARVAVLALPLTACGSLVAHALAYRIAAPNADARARLYRETGHGYLAYAPTFFAVSLALVFVGIILLALRFARGRRRGSVPIWPFAVLPLLMFTVQEHAERFVHTGHLPLGAVLEPTFLPGFLLQLPLALAMYAAARALLRIAEGLASILARSRARRRRVVATFSGFPLATCELPRIPSLALHRAGRAPPPSALAR